MSEEIKPILNRLKMFSKYKKYSYPIEMDISECKMLYDYINTLEETIKKKDEGIKALNEKALAKINNMFDVGNENTVIDDLLQLEKILKGDDNNGN